jgi:hypothetical protein
MDHAARPLAFRWILPAAQLVICIMVLWPIRGQLFHTNVGLVKTTQYEPSRTPHSNIAGEQIVILLDAPSRELQEALTQAERDTRRKLLPAMLNLPSGMIQLPFVIMNRGKNEWAPKGLDFKAWHAMSWPLLGIMFWWSAGRGIEALLASRKRIMCPRISLIETVVGLTLVVFCATFAIALPLYMGADRDFGVPLKFLEAGCWLWVVLSGSVFAAWILQQRLRRCSIAAAIR